MKIKVSENQDFALDMYVIAASFFMFGGLCFVSVAVLQGDIDFDHPFLLPVFFVIACLGSFTGIRSRLRKHKKSIEKN